MECPTVKVVDTGNEQGFKNINADDFDPSVHTPFEPTPEPEQTPESEVVESVTASAPASAKRRKILPPFPAA